MTDDIVLRLEALMERLRRLRLFDPRAAGLNVNVSLPQIGLLQWIASHPGCHVQEIAGALGLTPPTISVGVQRLIRAGLLQRKRDPEDRRATKLYLTRKASDMHATFTQARHSALETFLGGLSLDEQHELIALLEKAVRQAESKMTSKPNKENQQ
ncbi:MAG: MarR family transcriptional regulator [Chloroflexi bacterium]|nr:MarR family transcriptional regulator [Chloroflexota bacterium]